MSDRNRKLLFSAIGIILAVVPTALAVMSYFPIWVKLKSPVLKLETKE